MEEKKTAGVLNLINPKKKSSTPKKSTQSVVQTTPQDSKDAEARAKVDELLKGTSVSSLKAETIPEYNVEEIKQEKSAKWMEDQINMLNRQVEEQENEIVFYKNEIQRLQANQAAGSPVQNTGVQSVNNELPVNLVNLFRHFEKVYEGGYTDTKIAHPESGNGVLDKFQQFFPQLVNVKRYRYRPQQPQGR